MEITSQELCRIDSRYRSLLNTVIDYYYNVKIENGKIVAINHSPNCHTIFGYTADEFRSDFMLWNKIVYDEDKAIVDEQVDKLMRGKAVNFIEHRVVHKNGKLIWLRHIIVPFYDADGLLIEYDGLIADIANWKKAEEERRLSENKYREIFENTQDIYYRVDNNGILVDVSPSVEKHSGYKRDEIVGMQIENLYVNAAERQRLLNLIHEKGKLIDYEIELKSRNGELLVAALNSHLVYDANGNAIGIEGSLRDITERKATESKIKKLNQAIEQSPASVVITNVEGIIEYVNPRFTSVTGYLPEDVIGKKSRVLKAEKLTPDEYQILWGSIKKGEPWRGEYFNRKKNGECFWESVLISPILDEHGEVINFVIITEDITEKKQFLKDLIEAKEKAEKSDRLKSQFLAQMSHEIRTPINSIVNFSEILKEETVPEGSNSLHCFDAIDISCKRIIRTIDMILRMSEIQTGTYDCCFKQINLFEEVVEPVYTQFKERTETKKLDFLLSPPAEDIFVMGDRLSLENVFTNLLENAITFTPEGRVEMNVFVNSNKQACVSVADTGIGISDDFLSDIFKPFVQEDQGYSRRYEGNGLGLALAKSYCEINNADIHVESKKGAGSKFTVRFNQTVGKKI